MAKSHPVWKIIAPLLCLAAIGDLAAKGSFPATSPVSWTGSLAYAFAAVGVVQYAFRWPRVPRLIWRVFGPTFSLAMIWPVASGIGWLATRLAVKRLTLPEQATTASLAAALALYGFVIVVPLYRLGEWKHLSGSAQTAEAVALRDTFA